MIRTALPLLLLLGLPGCSTTRVPLKEGLVKRLGPEEFQKLQCYVSHGILLRRVLKDQESTVQGDHTLKIEQGRRIEEIRIPGNSPGVVVDRKDGKLFVAFEPAVDGKERTLTFAYHFRAGETRYYLEPETRGQDSDRLMYGGREYGSAADNRWAHLQIDKDTDRDVEYDSRKLPGRRIESEPKK